MQPLDIVLWGASGYTGRLVAEYLDRRAPRELRWAIGGRNRNKLELLRAGLTTQPEILTGDSLDRAAIEPIVARARVIVSTVGPFARYGTPLVRSCVEQGVDYCDITGETHWIRGNVDRLHDRAVGSGARIVHCCGFDSIPSDLGVWMMHDHLQRKHGRRLASARYYLTKTRGGFSGGTVASILHLMRQVRGDGELRRVLSDPYSLNPVDERRGPDRADQRGARFDEQLGRWTAPFLMAGINTRIVRRSNALLGFPYGRDFRYREVVATGNQLQARMLSAGLGAMMLGALFGPGRWLMGRFLPAPGQGPSPQQRASGFFNVKMLGRSDGEQPLRVQARVGGESDPGYGETSKMLAESALCLALDDLPRRGGILTPASALGGPLLGRLRAAGMTFSIEGEA